MNILAAIRREERKFEKQVGKLQHQLDELRAAARASGHTADRELTEVKKRVLSAAAKKKISRAAKRRWATFRARAKKATR
jgi:hypothetical protein